MAMMLPDELAWPLEMFGFDWPTANEEHIQDQSHTAYENGAVLLSGPLSANGAVE
ncbi:hypothetical protein [Streptomyces sp. NPDC051684]|uniref:hypothetical protein n=1 Tax=Streptomyces sp. NPDC051684 TaxID=3365670 RepID=UPI0037ADA80B